jgi:hypothetical protein
MRHIAVVTVPSMHAATAPPIRLLFVHKEKQKNFAYLGRAGFAATGPVKQKFLRRFFSKRGSFPPTEGIALKVRQTTPSKHKTRTPPAAEAILWTCF